MTGTLPDTATLAETAEPALDADTPERALDAVEPALDARERAREMSARIKERARAEGFQEVGIVEALPLLEERARLEEWLRRGLHGEMQWMARDTERRTDPRALLPSARSVVVVALNYYTPHEHSGDAHDGSDGDDAHDAPGGKISRYAWGDDYHDILGEKLRALLCWIREQWPEAEGRVCVDAQPAMDKVWAVRAGLGWIGKHTNLITPTRGSWVFLGELLLNLELACDTERVADHCGSCTLCLEACPTGALVEPYLLDSNRCISYATIELRREELPTEVAANLEGWLYGCDTCQDVCPWNRFQQPTDEPRFEPRPDSVSPKLDHILRLTPDTYAARFRRSPIKRAKLAGLQRNARALLEHARPAEPDDAPRRTP